MSARTPSVLLVEDHAAIGRVLARFLRERGQMDVRAVVHTAEAALEHLANSDDDGRDLDLVLIDVSLPGMSGIDLVAELARLYPELPCLMVSAHQRLEYVRQALENGARGYVAKGNPSAIIDAVRRILDGELYLNNGVRRAMDA